MTLVLSRHADESVMVGDDIRVVVVEIRPDKVRLGIDAPLDVPVHRTEVYEAIQRENAKALKPSSPVKAKACEVNLELLGLCERMHFIAKNYADKNPNPAPGQWNWPAIAEDLAAAITKAKDGAP